MNRETVIIQLFVSILNRGEKLYCIDTLQLTKLSPHSLLHFRDLETKATADVYFKDTKGHLSAYIK